MKRSDDNRISQIKIPDAAVAIAAAAAQNSTNTGEFFLKLICSKPSLFAKMNFEFIYNQINFRCRHYCYASFPPKTVGRYATATTKSY